MHFGITASTAVAPYTGPLNLDTSPYRGCAAALKCVPDNYCTVEGIASDAPVVLTKELYELRVPLTVIFQILAPNVSQFPLKLTSFHYYH